METWWFDPGTSGSGVNFGVVVFDTRGGNFQPQPVRVLWGNTVPRIRAITHSTNANLSFAGWLDERGNLWDIDTRTVRPGDDVDGDGFITLTALWEPGTVTVNFVTNYNQIYSADKIPRSKAGPVISVPVQRVVPGGKIIEPSGLPSDGIHGFLGWFTTDGGLITDANEAAALYLLRWDFNDPVSLPSGSSITLYARWSAYSRTIHLQVNGGTRPDNTQLQRLNFTIFSGIAGSVGGRIIDPGPLVRTGYTFAGWFTESGVEWNFSEDLVREVDDWDTTIDPARLRNDAFILHARWVPNIYFVRFEAGGGTPAPANQNVEHGKRAERPPVMTKAGEDFTGWFTDTGAEWNFNFDIVTSSMTLYARWEVTIYTVVFHWGNPPITPIPALPLKPADQRVAAAAAGRAVEPPPPVVHSGYSFFRWDYSTADPNDPIYPLGVNDPGFRATLLPWNFNTALISAPAGALNGNVLNLYARWVPPEPDMVWVPGGSFIMGDAGVSGSPAAYHAYPTRTVTLDGFYISRYPVTQINSPDTNKGYQQIMGVNPSQFSRNTFRPVERVSWYDAIEYCIRLNNLPENVSLGQTYSMTGIARAAVPLPGTPPDTINPIVSATVTWIAGNPRGYRLPTEAEWEYAARGGHGTPGNFIYAGSNSAEAVAWYNETVKTMPSGYQSTQTVGTKAPNALRIFDMSGNISEWVWDLFAPYNTITTLTNNPRGSASGTERVRRGGAWSNAASNVRSVVRNSDTPDTATWVNGFRVVRGRGEEIW